MKTILLCALLCALSFSAFAQDAPKASDKPVTTKPAPTEAIIPAETVKELQRMAESSETARLRAENLQLKIAQAQRELQDLNDASKKAQETMNNFYQRAALKAGVPSDALDSYTGQLQPDGSMKLVKKPAPAQ